MCVPIYNISSECRLLSVQNIVFTMQMERDNNSPIDKCIWNKSYMRTAEMKSNEEWSSRLWTQFMQLRKKPEKINKDFNGIWIRDLAIPVSCSNQLSYEATDSPIVF